MRTAVIAFVVVLCLAVVHAAAEEELNACPDVCTGGNQSPVCGRNKDGERKSFDSQCKLNVHNCRNPTKRYNVIYRKACTR